MVGVDAAGPLAPRAQHASLVQAALDRARRLGIALSPPVRLRADHAGTPEPGATAAGEAPKSMAAARRPPAASAARRQPGGTGAAGVDGRFDALIRAAAAREGVDPALVRAVAQAESSLDPRAISPAGARGLMQLMDGTARDLGVSDSLDPVQNVAGGTKYLRALLDRFGGDVTRTLAAYNAGPGAVDRYGGPPPFQETQAYVRKVLGLREQYRQATWTAERQGPTNGHRA
jgi:soluble lytic murein transglycosylase-like protein